MKGFCLALSLLGVNVGASAVCSMSPWLRQVVIEEVEKVEQDRWFGSPRENLTCDMISEEDLEGLSSLYFANIDYPEGYVFPQEVEPFVAITMDDFILLSSFISRTIPLCEGGRCMTQVFVMDDDGGEGICAMSTEAQETILQGIYRRRFFHSLRPPLDCEDVSRRQLKSVSAVSILVR